MALAVIDCDNLDSDPLEILDIMENTSDYEIKWGNLKKTGSSGAGTHGHFCGRQPKSLEDGTEDKIKEMLENGHTCSEVCRATGLTPWVIDRVCKELNIEHLKKANKYNARRK